MDPVSLIVAAVALGAATGISETAAVAVREAYDSLKGLLKRRDVDVSGIERQPNSELQRAALEETLHSADDVIDETILAAAQEVADAVAASNPSFAESIGVDIKNVQAEFVRIQAVRSSGTGVKLHESTFSGGIEVSDVVAVEPSRREDPQVR